MPIVDEIRFSEGNVGCSCQGVIYVEQSLMMGFCILKAAKTCDL